MPNGFPSRFLPRVNFSEAEGACAKLSAHIVSIHSAEENDFVRELWGGYQVRKYNGDLGFPGPILFHALNDAQLIGLRKDRASGWAWLDGSPSDDYSNWSPSQPDNFGGRETIALMTMDSTWNDAPETYTTRFVVCKRRSQASTTAPTRSQSQQQVTAAPIGSGPAASVVPTGQQPKQQQQLSSSATLYENFHQLVVAFPMCLMALMAF